MTDVERRRFGDLEFTIVFQPIFDIAHDCTPYAYEALVRGLSGEGASVVLGSIEERDRDAFDAACRAAAVEIAVAYQIPYRLSLNLAPSAMCSPDYGIYSTIRVAKKLGYPEELLIFEVTENENCIRFPLLRRNFDAYRRRGIKIAVDDFGAGYAGLSSVVMIAPDIIKLDASLVRNIDTDPLRQALVRGNLDAFRLVGISVIAEGVETEGERDFLKDAGISLMQGYYFSAPSSPSMLRFPRNLPVSSYLPAAGPPT